MATGRLFHTTGPTDRGTVWNAAKRRRRNASETPSLSDLQQLLALSPSLLIWPAKGSGWQGTSGGTLSATGQPVGLLTDLAALEGKTQAAWLAAPTTSELVTNGGFDSGTGWTVGGTQASISGGVAAFTSTAAYNTDYVDQGVSIVENRLYRIQLTVSNWVSGAPRLDRVGIAVVTSSFGTGNGVKEILYRATTTSSALFRFTPSTGGFEGSIDNISIKELPGNHLRAGTWASPADASRPLLTAGGAVDFDGSNDYFSLLNAISITESMTVVRAFKRSAAGIVSVGLGRDDLVVPRGPLWNAGNAINVALGDSASASLVSNTETGSFVMLNTRNASTEKLRLNGAEIGSRSSAAASGSLSVFARVLTSYNSGEISFLAVFPTELTGAQLALVERIAAGTNGTVLA